MWQQIGAFEPKTFLGVSLIFLNSKCNLDSPGLAVSLTCFTHEGWILLSVRNAEILNAYIMELGCHSNLLKRTCGGQNLLLTFFLVLVYTMAVIKCSVAVCFSEAVDKQVGDGLSLPGHLF